VQARPGLAIHPDGEMQPREARSLGPECIEDLLGIVGLHPRAQEPGRYRQVGEIVDDLFQLQPGKPRVEHVLAHGGSQPGPDALEKLRCAHRLAVLAAHDHPPFVAAQSLSVRIAPVSTTRRRVHRHRVISPKICFLPPHPGTAPPTWPVRRCGQAFSRRELRRGS